MVADTTSTSPSPRWVVVRRVVPVVAALVRAVGVILLGVSMVWGWRAWYARFGVCVGGDPPVELPADQREWWCSMMQDHRYDQVMPSAPWVPIPDVASFEGLSLVVLGVGVAVVAVSLVGRWFVWVASVVAGVGVGTAWVGMGVPVWHTAMAGGERVGFDIFMAASSLTVVTMLVTVGVAVLSWRHGGRDRRLLALFWVLVTLAQPWPEYFASMFLWGSHDTSPALGLLRCVLVGLAWLLVLLMLMPPSWRPPVPTPVLRAVGAARRFWADGTAGPLR